MLYGTDSNELDLEQIKRYQQQESNKDEKKHNLILYLNSILDTYVLGELDDSNEEYLALLTIPLLALLLRNGVPTRNTMKNTLYSYNYNNITYPIYYKEAVKEPFLKNNYHTRVFIESKAKQNAINELNLQLRRLSQCKEYIDGLPVSTQINSKKYVKYINKHPYSDRGQLIQRTINNPKATSNVRKPNMNFNKIINDTRKHIRNQAVYDVKDFSNETARKEAKAMPYPTKTWIWSGKSRTRHRMMGGTIVPFDDPFRVVNERTGEMCMLRFPRDYANDPTGANTVNCGCSVVYNHRTSKPIPEMKPKRWSVFGGKNR